jgi:Holliday junction resolvasome RuvABC endonuclease subunit
MKRTLILNPNEVGFPKYIMVNDPSITAWGWVILRADGKIIEAGAIKTTPSNKKLQTRKGDDRVRRVTELNVELIRLIKKYNVCLLISELPHGSQSAVAAVMIGMVSGVMQTIGDCLNIPVEWYSEGDAKKAISGKRSVEKDEMVEIVKGIYTHVPWKETKWQDQAIADSLAVYHVAKQQSQMLKLLMK